VWKNFGTKFTNILDALRRHKQLIESQASLLHFQQCQHDSHATLLLIQQYQRSRSELFNKLQKQEEAESQRKYREVITWIAAADTTIQDHESFCATRREYPGSGEWILKHEKVQNWKQADNPVSSILWLNGIPGAGMPILPRLAVHIFAVAHADFHRQDNSCLCDHR